MAFACNARPGRAFLRFFVGLPPEGVRKPQLFARNFGSALPKAAKHH